MLANQRVFSTASIPRSRHLKHDQIGGVPPDLPGDHLHPVVHGAELLGAVRVQHLVGLVRRAVPFFCHFGPGGRGGRKTSCHSFAPSGLFRTRHVRQTAAHRSTDAGQLRNILVVRPFCLRVHSSTTTPPIRLPFRLRPLSNTRRKGKRGAKGQMTKRLRPGVPSTLVRGSSLREAGAIRLSSVCTFHPSHVSAKASRRNTDEMAMINTL